MGHLHADGQVLNPDKLWPTTSALATSMRSTIEPGDCTSLNRISRTIHQHYSGLCSLRDSVGQRSPLDWKHSVQSMDLSTCCILFPSRVWNSLCMYACRFSNSCIQQQRLRSRPH
jgi:hypothetical protein